MLSYFLIFIGILVSKNSAAPVSCSSVAATPAIDLVGPVIGSGSKVCKIVAGSPTNACSYYVRYRYGRASSYYVLTILSERNIPSHTC